MTNTVTKLHEDINTTLNNIIQFPYPTSNQTINISKLKDTKIYTPINLTNSCDIIDNSIKIKHDSEPIKSLSDIKLIADHLLSQKKYRDYMLFIIGINFGLRASDLLRLKFSDIINTDGTFKYSFELIEQKTSTTRKHIKCRYIQINKAVQNAVITYLTEYSDTTLSDYLFTSQKHDTDEDKNITDKTRPISVKQMERIIKDVCKELSITGRFATHTLRKTFGYHMMQLHNNDPRFLAILQKIYGHSSSTITLSYIGITQDEIDVAYENLNLGLREGLIDSDVYEG
jgi:integrase